MDDIDEAFAAVELKYAQIVIEFVSQCISELRELTPVDTGHARANWIASRGSPFGGGDEEDGRVSTRRGERRTNAGGAASAGDADILSYTLADGPAFIANNVPYMVGPGSLNDGHSSQRAAGWIEYAVAQTIWSVARRHDLEGDFSVSVVGVMRGF